MCTWITEKIDVVAHGKGVPEWTPFQTASVSFDHPTSTFAEHALILDFFNEAQGAGARVAVEMTAESARALVAAIERALERGTLENVQ